MPLDPRTVAMMNEAFSAYGPCRDCGRPAERLYHSMYFCCGCYDARFHAPPPVEVRVSGDPQLRLGGRVRR